MISLAPGTKVYLASKPVSMRLGFDGLAALVRPLFLVEPYSGHVFLFRSKSGNYLKALCWDGTGLCLFAKRLERHRFVWPPLVDGGVVLSPAQFSLLLEAMDWRRTVAPERPRIPMQI
jgi:transposase